MTHYEPFGELLSDRPVFAIRQGLSNCKTVIAMAQEARAKGYEVQVVPGGFVHDIRVQESKDSRPISLTVRGAREYLMRIQ